MKKREVVARSGLCSLVLFVAMSVSSLSWACDDVGLPVDADWLTDPTGMGANLGAFWQTYPLLPRGTYTAQYNHCRFAEIKKSCNPGIFLYGAPTKNS